MFNPNGASDGVKGDARIPDFRKLLVNFGDNKRGLSAEKATQLESLRKEATEVSSVLQQSMELLKHGTECTDVISNAISECANSFPHKSAEYALLLKLLTRKLKPEVGYMLVGKLMDKVSSLVRYHNS